MGDNVQLPKSKFEYGGRKLHELSHAELLESVENLWATKNGEIDKLNAENKGLRCLLSSSLPVHSLWRGCVENAMLLLVVGIIAYFAGAC